MGLLDRLFGTWVFTMHHTAMAEPIVGEQRCERVLDGAFVMLQSTYEHPDFPDAMVLISEDRYYYFDVRGITRVFDLTADKTNWTISRIADDGLSQRTTTSFTSDDRMSSIGEASSDRGATWELDFTVTYERR